MSFLDDILDIGSDVWDWASGNSTSAGLARAAALAYLLKQITDSINKDNNKDTTDNSNKAVQKSWTRTQIDPSTDNIIPIMYGEGFCGGVITDAILSEDNMTMWYVITLCEKTGTLMSSEEDSVITIKNIYWNEAELVLGADGITATKLTDADGNQNTEINGLVKIYLFNDGSLNPCNQFDGNVGNTDYAYNIMPGWDSTYTMDKLVFAIVKVTYDAIKNTTGIGDMKFKLSNSLSMPGDVLYDYMTNTRYGAGIDSQDIYDQ